jgi:hypothetical protein
MRGLRSSLFSLVSFSFSTFCSKLGGALDSMVIDSLSFFLWLRPHRRFWQFESSHLQNVLVLLYPRFEFDLPIPTFNLVQ